jgi:16S rRNA G966 N2-methylase RsmD
LFACTGQIGLEALSRNAGLVIFNDLNRDRISDIRSNISRLEMQEKSLVFNLGFNQCLTAIRKNCITPDIIFLDPPYPKTKGEDPYTPALKQLLATGMLARETLVVVQHHH